MCSRKLSGAGRQSTVSPAAGSVVPQTKGAAAYDALVKLIDQPSWRDTVRASGLSGLAALGDKRALELGFKYSATGNRTEVRSAALTLLGATGKDDPRTLPILTAALNEAFERRSFQLLTNAANALLLLGDERGVSAFDELIKKAGPSSQFTATLINFETRLKAKLTAAKPGS